MLLDDIKNIKGSKKDFKKFGLVVGAFVILSSVYLFYFQSSTNSYYLAVLGIVLVAISFVVPIIFKPIYKPWMILALMMSWLMTRIFLGIIFYLVITPIGIIAKLFGKQFLDVKINRLEKSYWNYRGGVDIVRTKSYYDKQF